MKKGIELFLLLIFAIAISFIGNLYINTKIDSDKKLFEYYLGGIEAKVILYNEQYQKVDDLYRGTKIKSYGEVIKVENTNKEYIKVIIDNNEYLVLKDNIVEKYEDVIYEKEKYVRTSVTVYEDKSSSKILGFIKKGQKVKIIGFDGLKDGFAQKYKIVYNDELEGFVYSKYLVDSEEESIKNYDEEGNYQIHLKRGNTQGGGDAGSLDFYPYEKASFNDNKMPTEVRSLYLNAEVVKNVDSYISLAKESNINAFVVDIKDNTKPAYVSDIMKKYSITNYNHAINSYDEYKNAIKKLKDNGFYVIGRITVFKDNYYVTDHSESAIADVSTGEPYKLNGSYWPSAYNRKVWEFNVELAKEAVIEFGFNEIQFDYVRFPDRTTSLEKNGILDLKNIYSETKSQAIQNFLFYACDQIHEVGAYVSADVFGESAHNYVTGYGQYWGAISNVVDVISAMPYPDHFGAYEYGINEIVWTVPYKLIYIWGSEYAVKKQSEIPTPAIARTWIQAYNTVKEPYIVYDSNKVYDQIKALKDSGLSGGYITWNSASSLQKYREISSAFKE